MSTISPTRSTHDHGTKADADVAPGEIAVGVVIGRASEYFDFFVFGIASALVFPAVFFPFMDRLQGTLWSFALFALAFVARPLGTVLFMALQARWGRGVKLTISLFLLGTAPSFPVTARSAAPPSCCSPCSACCRAWRWAARGTACRRCWH